MHDGMPYGRNQGQGQGHSREVDRQSPTGLIFYLFFFSDQRREETRGRILTRNGSKDAESRKDVPFWGYKMNN